MSSVPVAPDTREAVDAPPPPDSAPSGPPAASAADVARARWRRWRVPLIAFVAVVLVVTGTVLLRPRVTAGTLDPDSTAPDGSRAVAQVLQRQGVEVTTVRRAEQARELSGPGSTLLVVRDTLLTPALLDDLEEYAETVVLVQPDGATLDGIGAPLEPVAEGDGATDPGCDAPAAQAAGPVDTDALLYRAVPGGEDAITLCYPQSVPSDGRDDADDTEEPAGAVAVWEHDGGRLVVLGSPEPLANSSAAEPGLGALALWTLGSEPDLVWWLVSPNDPAFVDGPRVDPMDLLPGWVSLVTWQFVLVALAAIWWRGRRLGRLVPEPLPVVVRSSETTRGRAALYRRARARGRAATVLRARTLGVLTRRLGLAASASPPEVVATASAATGTPGPQVHHLLFGPAPLTDLELTGLADALDQLVESLHPPTDHRPSSRKARQP